MKSRQRRKTRQGFGSKRCFHTSAFSLLPSRRGFTLMELTIVLLILGVISAMAMPTFIRFYRKMEAEQTMQQLTQMLRFAHQDAIFKRKVRIVTIDFETDTYYLQADPVAGDYSGEVRKRMQAPLPEGFEFQSVYYPEREEIVDSQESAVQFYPNGTADKVKLTIQRVNERGFIENVYVVRVNGVDGHIKVREKVEDEESYF